MESRGNKKTEHSRSVTAHTLPKNLRKKHTLKAFSTGKICNLQKLVVHLQA
jgi:hypothetical protein